MNLYISQIAIKINIGDIATVPSNVNAKSNIVFKYRFHDLAKLFFKRNSISFSLKRLSTSIPPIGIPIRLGIIPYFSQVAALYKSVALTFPVPIPGPQ
ncbi:MAG TPA: hypothetical protein OIL90_05575 [Phascolarctobacterium faecium]|uniref:hypothetical protein n=1 Tax=Phascolarctobacterium faecium TaxID=33025 RepID=UPI00242EEA6D|nr:hypothetical protein [Phascolarctobacterium faecium]HJI09574.1 hypothetical protein [Phascolarctobacterium faecium]